MHMLLYSKFGFTPLKSPERYMELHNSRCLQKEGLL